MLDPVAPEDIHHLVILGHPSGESFNHMIANRYCEAVRACGETAVRHPYERYPELSLCPALGERSLLSVANLTRADGHAFMSVAAEAPLHTTTTVFPLGRANEALAALRNGRIEGAAVLVPDT
ncbi:MAG: hypothetical protein ABI810_07215 [Sphingomonas bacterium]